MVELCEMDLNLQAKLLRVIQERELSRIGGNDIIKLDFRLIVATHRDLGKMVQEGTFREDLYYRLLGLPIELPPLRDRDSDIIVLSKYFLEQFAKDKELPVLKLGHEAQTKLLGYPFPGNIRELKSIIELSAVMANSEEIEASDIAFNSISKESNFLLEEMTMRDYTFKIVRFYLDKYNDNVLKVADKLDIGKSTIYRHLKEMEEEGI